MKKLFFDDQAHIAGQFQIVEDHTTQIARLAFHKINSYKLSLNNEAYCMSRVDLKDLIKGSLLNYVNPFSVLFVQGFFNDEVRN